MMQAWISFSVEHNLKTLGKTPVSTTDKGKLLNNEAGPKMETETKTRSVNLHNMSTADYLALQQHFSEKLVTTEKPIVKFEESNSAIVPYNPVGRLLNPKNPTSASGTSATKTYNANSVTVSPADIHSVIDCGCNGDIAGKNDRVISFHPDMHANIGNIGNTQQLTNLGLGIWKLGTGTWNKENGTRYRGSGSRK